MVNFDQRKIKYVEWSNIYMCEQFGFTKMEIFNVIIGYYPDYNSM